MLDKTIAIILAGGAGARLQPLTVDRAKPAVPFGGKYRIVDFSLFVTKRSAYRSVQTRSAELGQIFGIGRAAKADSLFREKFRDICFDIVEQSLVHGMNQDQILNFTQFFGPKKWIRFKGRVGFKVREKFTRSAGFKMLDKMHDGYCGGMLWNREGA